MTSVEIQGANRLFQLADEARTERGKWRTSKMRHELDHIARQLEEAGRIALTASEVWADAWAEAGVLTLRKYQSQRKLIEHLG